MSNNHLFYRWKTSPCVRSKRPRVFPAPRAHVFQHVRVVPVHTGTFWIYARRVFSPSQAAPHTTTTHNTHTTHKQRTTTRNNTRTHRQGQGQGQTQTQRQTETERKDRDRERRQDGQRRDKRRRKRRQKKTRQEKRREKIHFQCGGAWPVFLLMWWFSGWFRLRTRLEPPKQCQVRFILDFSAPWQVNSFFYYLRINFSMQLQFSFFF